MLKKQLKPLNIIYLYKHGEKYGRIQITNNVTNTIQITLVSSVWWQGRRKGY